MEIDGIWYDFDEVLEQVEVEVTAACDDSSHFKDCWEIIKELARFGYRCKVEGTK